LPCLKTFQRLVCFGVYYGAHNIALLATCKKGEEGLVIHDIRKSLQKLDVKAIDTCVGFIWEKADMTLTASNF